jgi:hypothetical protein
MIHLLLMLLALTPQSDWKRLQCTGEFFSGRYVNYAEGFSVGLPPRLKGKRGQASGPERGFSIPLSADCAGVIAFDGEANSLEWANAHTAAVATAKYYDNAIILRRYRTKLGRLAAEGVVIRYRDRSDIDEFVVAIRPGRSLVYTARLGTTEVRYRQDHRRFVEVLRRFRLEPWR